MYGDASGNIGDLSGNFSDSGGGPSSADVAASLGLDIGTPGTSTAPSLDPAALAESIGYLSNPMAPVSLAELAAAVQGMNLAGKSSVDLSGIGGQREHSTGVSYSDLAALAQAGLGKMDIPGFNQNVEQALAAQNVHNVLNYAAPAFAGLIPGYGTVSALGKGIANIHGLMTGRLSAKDVVPGLAAGLIGARTGIPSGIVEGIITGDLGKTVGSGAQAGLGALVSGITGNPMAGALASSTLGPAVGRAASEAVGGSKAGGLGAALGLSSAPSPGSSPTGNTYGDTGINADAYSVLAAIEQAAQEPKQPEWSSQMTAGRYGPLMEYEFGA